VTGREMFDAFTDAFAYETKEAATRRSYASYGTTDDAVWVTTVPPAWAYLSEMERRAFIRAAKRFDPEVAA
jgi:hypothetical protein